MNELVEEYLLIVINEKSLILLNWKRFNTSLTALGGVCSDIDSQLEIVICNFPHHGKQVQADNSRKNSNINVAGGWWSALG